MLEIGVDAGVPSRWTPKGQTGLCTELAHFPHLGKYQEVITDKSHPGKNPKNGKYHTQTLKRANTIFPVNTSISWKRANPAYVVKSSNSRLFGDHLPVYAPD